MQFPFHRNPRHHRDWVAEREGWVNGDVFEVLALAQPYHAAKDTIHPLRVLQVLSNTDKHRLLNVVTHAHISQGIHLNPEPPTYDFWAADGPVNVGDPIARLTYPRPPFSIEMDVAPGFGWYESVAYEESGQPKRWLRIDEMLNAICDYTIRAVGYMSGAREGDKLDRNQELGTVPPG